MRTIDSPSNRVASRWARLRRDGALLLRLGGMLGHYLLTGRRVRRAYRRKEARGDTYWLDDASADREHPYA